MKLAFAGTPEFARVALQALLDAGHHVALVLTQPDRPAGRGLKLQASLVKQLAERQGLRLVQPRGLRQDGKFGEDALAAKAALRDAAPEVMVVAAYGLILPPWVLELPRQGCLNIHASLLPRWRGAAPIQRAIEAGDRTSGITIMRMDAGLDSGPMLLEQAVPIADNDTAASLHDHLAALGARLIVEALARLPELAPRPQPAVGVTYARKIDKSEAAIDWRDRAVAIERRLRAFDPFPGCTAELDGVAIKVWRGRVQPAAPGVAPGTRVDAWPGRCVVACGEQALELLEVQLPGGKRQPVHEWLSRKPTPRSGSLHP
jgi:methionyl-tRNA formyltransferase